MQGVELSNFSGSSVRVLCLGAHCDDIEIGCGGTIAVIAERYPLASFRFIVFSSDQNRSAETITCLSELTGDPKRYALTLHKFRDGYFPYHASEIKDYFETLKDEERPDLIFTHQGFDRHQDHRLISELTWNTFRNELILEYEIPKYDGGLTDPVVFVPLTEKICETKVSAILRCHISQTRKHWFTQDTFASLLRLRGIECNSRTGYAEGFYCRKLTIDVARALG